MAERVCQHAVLSAGAGFHGQLGNGDYEDCLTPTECCGQDGAPYLVLHLLHMRLAALLLAKRIDGYPTPIVSCACLQKPEIVEHAPFQAWHQAYSWQNDACMAATRLGADTGGCPMHAREQSQQNGLPAVVACGANHSMLISRRGELFTWGLCSSGELGHRDTPIDLNTPHQAWPQLVPTKHNHAPQH